jgi:hypothetical protein
MPRSPVAPAQHASTAIANLAGPNRPDKGIVERIYLARLLPSERRVLSARGRSAPVQDVAQHRHRGCFGTMFSRESSG